MRTTLLILSTIANGLVTKQLGTAIATDAEGRNAHWVAVQNEYRANLKRLRLQLFHQSLRISTTALFPS